MTKKDLVWRLKDRPSVADVTELLKEQVITKDEARSLLFNSVDENDKIAKLEQEVDLLKNALKDCQRGLPLTRALVDKYTTSHPLVDPFWLLRGII